MALEEFATTPNQGITVLDGALSDSATTIPVDSMADLKLTGLTGTDFAYCKITKIANWRQHPINRKESFEIVKVTAVSSNDLTAVRGADGTSGTAFASGDIVEVVFVSIHYQHLVDALTDGLKELSIGPLGIGGAPTATQSLFINQLADNNVSGIKIQRKDNPPQYITIGNFTGALIDFVAISKNFTLQNSAATSGDLLFNTNGANTRMRIGFDGNVEIVDGFLVLPKASDRGIKVDLTTPTYGFADILGDQFSKNTGATKPVLTAYNGAIFGWQFAASDEAYMTFHIPHDYVKGTNIFLHIHWSHIGTLVTGGTVTFKATSIYAKGHNQAAFGSPVAGTFNGSASTTQYQQIITEVQLSDPTPTGLEIDTDLLEPDGVIEMTFEVDVNGITVSGGGVPDPFIHFVDIHYQSMGLIGTKDKVPDFYA